MWQTDTVTLQTGTEVNTMGSVSITWASRGTVLCDVQDISTEYVHKEYGFTDANQFRQIFDQSNGDWVNNEQVSYDGEQWLVRMIKTNLYKIGASNHTYIIISKVV